MKQHLQKAKILWESLLTKKNLAIDATCGNGHDTLFLASLCHVVGIDIQKQAIENTKALLNQKNAHASLHLLSHEHIDRLPLLQRPKLIVYNLGYLPGSDKKITTRVSSTLKSVQKALKLLEKEGALSIMCYPGHEEGAKETQALQSWIQTLPWKTHRYFWKEKAPLLFWIKKTHGIREESSYDPYSSDRSFSSLRHPK